ncbi:hypothetical protein [Spiroplasma monobiae]|uniref:Uncharacterized protein n=1 Tax=Spiroplasma monobiae MQ-1 TaxID=1336748 RepID=A0A2K9LV56_SPISQ|nr:hypothetical protein [Spiroplasma monobiae]AUM62923.1 hypothetical protein SMONO_v1c06740 [Spiroplasma monobiae MQ-1]
MNIKIRKIDNTDWITNIFEDYENIYFSDSKPNSHINTLCYLSRNLFEENLKNKQDIDRMFLAHPNPTLSSLEMVSNTDLQIYGVYENYIQNFVNTGKKQYISFIINNKVFTSEVNDLKHLMELQIITKFSDKLVIKKENKSYFTDFDLKIISEINYDLVDIIEFENNYIIQDKEEKVILIDKNFNEQLKLTQESDFKKIYYLNKNNVLISSENNQQTLIYNFVSKTQKIFQEFFIKRAVLLNKDTLLIKKNEKNGERDLLNIII